MTRTLILGYDGSPCAMAALDAAVDVAVGHPDSRIVMVHGTAMNLAADGSPMAIEILPDGDTDIRARTKTVVKAMFDEAIARVTASGVTVETRIEWKAASVALMDVAKELDASMIVVGTQGVGAIRGMLLGSTAYKLLHHSKIPVLVVPHRR